MTVSSTPRVAPQRRANSVRVLWLLALVVALLLLCAASVAIGSRDVGWSDIIAAFGGATETLGQAAVSKRIPRTVMALLAGAALGLAGAVMQGVTRNPLADPGILGINMGAALAVVVGIAWFSMASLTAYIWVAISGATVTALLVYTLGSLGRDGATPLKLALAGAATSVALGSFITAVILPRNDISGGVRSWEIGGVGGAQFSSIGQVLPILLAGFAICLFSARRLNSLALGDELAAGLGENVMLARVIGGVGSVILCGATTAICGPIGFVGLVVPHLCRILVGVDHRWLLPFSGLAGAGLLVLADIAGRIVSRPGELDVGIVTAFIGAPFFIWIVSRRRVREL